MPCDFLLQVRSEQSCADCAFCRCILMTYQEHLGVTYLVLSEDRAPRMLIHNKCPVPLLMKETVKGLGGGLQTGGGVELTCCVSPLVTTAASVLFSCRSSEDGGPLSPPACEFLPAPRALPSLFHLPRVPTERRSPPPAPESYLRQQRPRLDRPGGHQLLRYSGTEVMSAPSL